MTARYLDRRDAGRLLSRRLEAYAGSPDAIVFGLPRGGVPVAYEVSKALRLPLDVYVVRKLGVPGDDELAMGAIGSYGAEVQNDDVILRHRVAKDAYERVRLRELDELRRREHKFRGDRPAPIVVGKTVILVDDGLATGATMRAAIAGVRSLDPRAIVVAVPVGDAEIVDRLRREADEVICAMIPRALYSVGAWYVDFTQTTDEEVRALLTSSL